MMYAKKKKFSLVAQHTTSVDDNVKYSDPSKEASNVSLRNSAMNIASDGDADDSRPVKKEEEETDSSEMPIEDACSSRNQVQSIVKEEECNDAFGTMVNHSFGTSASPMANSNFDKKKLGAGPDKAGKIEECDIDQDPLSHMTNISCVVVSSGNSTISLKPASSSHQVEKEELDDIPNIVMHVDESSPPSANSSRISFFEKETMKRKMTGIQSNATDGLSTCSFINTSITINHGLGLLSSAKACSQQQDEAAFTGTNGNDSSVVASQSVCGTRRYMLMDSSIEDNNSRNETTETETAAVAHDIEKKEDGDNLTTFLNLGRSLVTSPKRSSNFEKKKNNKSSLLSDISINESDLQGSHSHVANTAPVVPSEDKNSTSICATHKASTSRHKTTKSDAMGMDTTAPLDELTVPRDGGVTRKIVGTANETSDGESDCSEDGGSNEDFDLSAKRRCRLNVWESDAEAYAPAQDAHDDQRSGKKNDNNAATNEKDSSNKDELCCLDCPAVFKSRSDSTSPRPKRIKNSNIVDDHTTIRECNIKKLRCATEQEQDAILAEIQKIAKFMGISANAVCLDLINLSFCGFESVVRAAKILYAFPANLCDPEEPFPGIVRSFGAPLMATRPAKFCVKYRWASQREVWLGRIRFPFNQEHMLRTKGQKDVFDILASNETGELSKFHAEYHRECNGEVPLKHPEVLMKSDDVNETFQRGKFIFSCDTCKLCKDLLKKDRYALLVATLTLLKPSYFLIGTDLKPVKK